MPRHGLPGHLVGGGPIASLGALGTVNLPASAGSWSEVRPRRSVPTGPVTARWNILAHEHLLFGAATRLVHWERATFYCESGILSPVVVGDSGAPEPR
jgi:hypothetical protein